MKHTLTLSKETAEKLDRYLKNCPDDKRFGLTFLSVEVHDTFYVYSFMHSSNVWDVAQSFFTLGRII